MLRRSARRLYVGLAWVLAAGLLFQVFLAGLGIFNLGLASRGYWEFHRDFGSLLGLIPLILLVLAPLARLPRALIGQTGLLFLLFLVVMIAAWIPPNIAGFHPVLGFLMFLLTWRLARRSGKPPQENTAEADILAV